MALGTRNHTEPNSGPAIEVLNLRKVYGDVAAVDGISFQVRPGEIFCMVGPNGAGKTTTVECIEGLRKPDAGLIRVLGLNPHKDSHQLASRIGTQLQESALQSNIKVWEVLDLYASFYPRSADWRVLLERLNLSDKYHARYEKLSGGQKQRLKIALALVNDPEAVFLDELTTGLDPQARRDIWDLIFDIRSQGKTVFLTTHYMDEAERLADRVAIMNAGKIVALDSPRSLIRSLGHQVKVMLMTKGPVERGLLEGIPEVESVDYDTGQDDQGPGPGTHSLAVTGRGEGLVVAVVNALYREGTAIAGLRVQEPTLEDVFLALAGDKSFGRQAEGSERR